MNRERVQEQPRGDGADRRSGDAYRVSPVEAESFQANGYLVLPGVVAESELDAIEKVFEHFASGEVPGMGKDFCDMSGTLTRRVEEFSLINAMLPRVYHPSFQGNA